MGVRSLNRRASGPVHGIGAGPDARGAMRAERAA